jgi:predicted enzyme related to lactoylglutathione lyase
MVAYMLARLAVTRHRRGAMAEFMDVHREMVDITPEGLMEAHQVDLAIQDEEGVDFKHASDEDPEGWIATFADPDDNYFQLVSPFPG